VRRIDVPHDILRGAQLLAVPTAIPGAHDAAIYQPRTGDFYLIETTPAGSPCARRIGSGPISMRWTSIVALRRNAYAFLDATGYLCFLTFTLEAPCQPL
jgi:hypothetical protein